ncbi:MAG: tetratricopeptide repeat protein [Verrucomicrobia bacterium]|nr:tetratricopeptide repeat protein [Verrucomicrobiota bacterium]MDA1086139.1 tetratricopeptide repeat protein [Verrucomicrobiota bacterium]
MKRRWIVTALVCAIAAGAFGATPETLFREGKRHEEQGDFVRAIESYRKFLNDYAGHSQVTDVRYRLARSQDAIGLMDEAIANLETVVKKGGDRFRQRQDAMFMLGNLLGDVERYDDAIRIYEALLVEGAGLFHDEVLNRLGGYYAVQEKYDEAAAKLNILKRRKDSKFAEQAAYKLSMIWIRAGNLDLAVDAVSDLATRWPQNEQARGLMLQIADKFREQRKYEQAVAACEQLRTGFPKTREGQAAGYILGRIYLDRDELALAAQTFEAVARMPENRKLGLSADAMLQSADLYFGKLNNVDKAMELYEEASSLAREDVSARDRTILAQCYFRLGEHQFAKQEWSVALEYFTLLRELGTEINILPRIMKCQAELHVDLRAELQNEKELDFIRQKIKENPNTFAAAEGEIFLLDRDLESRLERTVAVDDLIEAYRDVLVRYPKAVVSEQHLESYIYIQLARLHAKLFRDRVLTGHADLEWQSAITFCERALELDPDTPYRVDLLELMAGVADQAGQTSKAFDTYRRLYDLARAGATTNTDAAAIVQMTEYMRSMLTRADEGDSIEKAIAAAREIIAKDGKDAPTARHAMFYIGDLYYLRKDFSGAAKAYREFIKAYGPPQTPEGEISGGPWKPGNVNESVRQVQQAALRIAHCWYLQGHSQNMIKAYQWIVRNLPIDNSSVGEAEYWLAMELTKGEAAKTKDAKLQLADQLWKRVVNPSLDFEAENFAASYHPWVRDEQMRQYVQLAMLKSGEIYSEMEKHRVAAEIFGQYLSRFPPHASRGAAEPTRDEELHSMARYALGREYIALGELGLLVGAYRPYVDGLRGDRLRVSALKLLGYHGTRNKFYDDGIIAYATLLDEYGRNVLNADGNPLPLAPRLRLRGSNPGWNGIRMDAPADLDLGATRYALGYIYWMLEEWDDAIKVLEPFISDKDLRDNKARAKSLHMVGRCMYRQHDYQGTYEAMSRIVKYPAYAGFKAIEEAYVYTARAAMELEKWDAVHETYTKFVEKHPMSLQRPHIDLYQGGALLRGGQAVEALPILGNLARSDTYQDVKADALFYLGVYQMTKLQENYKAASKLLDQSIEIYPREDACLVAARCAVRLKRWDKAAAYLERALREFPTGKPRVLAEASKLLPSVKKELAKME